MHSLIVSAQLKAFGLIASPLGGLVLGDAQSGTVGIANKFLTFFQVIGIALAAAVGAGYSIWYMFAGQQGKEKVKSHGTQVVVGVIVLFAVTAIATFVKSYSQSSFG